ncbi:hypothetical protein G7Y89_g14351 [Cudoniella acicularis]|uniref:CRAL-TRIO domain-containing protein n=1 Tax=Cudoniella acicularis TaxID=354080 RepID=A0A8H4VU58_9HELO|nr:hypothetical protein G7Y89_g14351 [Cudoniella acicularis]
MLRGQTVYVSNSTLPNIYGRTAPVILLRACANISRRNIVSSISFLLTRATLNHRRSKNQPLNDLSQSSLGLQQYSTTRFCLRKTHASLCDSQRSKQTIGSTSSRTVLAYLIPIKAPSPTTSPLQSHAGSWTAAVVVSVIIVVCAYFDSPAALSHNISLVETFTNILENAELGSDINMTGNPLPGRVGNLTADQEEKLKEFWVATLQVFGVLNTKELNGNGNGHTDPAANGRARSDTSGSKKPKKKRMSLFRRNHADDSESISSQDSGSYTPIGSSDLDDKYGQTKEFHDALATLSPESLRATFWSMVKHDHPDALLLRFLRARKWDVEKALIMMVSTMRWRARDVHVDDDIMKNGELAALEAANGDDSTKRRLGEDFLSQMRMGKSYLHGLDKEGRPMCFVRARLHKQGEQSEESLERYTVFTIETARMILAPPADTACVVFDMTGFSLANMDYTPVKFMIKCFEANYPESLGVVLVHKAPWVFQGIWKIIRGWLDPVVASKVQFTNNIQEMEQYVPSNHIIKELDGAEDWAYRYIEPVPGENDAMKDTDTRDKLLREREVSVQDYEKATLEWIHATTTDLSSIKETRNSVANALRDGYWVLDPYVRARSYYDRVGMISAGGKPRFYPEPTPTTAALTPISNGIPKPVETSADDLD